MSHEIFRLSNEELATVPEDKFGERAESSRVVGGYVVLGVEYDRGTEVRVIASSQSSDSISNIESFQFSDGTTNIGTIGEPSPVVFSSFSLGASNDVALTQDVLESGTYGNKFNGSTDLDGIVEASFEGTITDLVLYFKGYDVDDNDEIEVLLNGVSQGFIDAGINNELAPYSMAISAADQISGTNIVTFKQAGNVNWKWGVTDLLLSETRVTDITLTLDDLDSGSFGNKFDEQTDADGAVTATFQSTGTDLVLNFKGYDVDYNNEIELFLNGVSQGFLNAGVNNGLADYFLVIAASNQLTGTNSVTFQQAGNVNWKWGVTDLVLTEDTVADISLAQGVLEDGEYGNKFNGATDADGIITATFENTGADMVLDFKGYDIDSSNEMEVLLNGVSQGFVLSGVNNGLDNYNLAISATDQVSGTNTVAFQQATNPNWKWGVTDLLLKPASVADIFLTKDVLEADAYGNKFSGTTDTDGKITAAFDFTGADVTLNFKGYDIDLSNEVELFLNGVSQGFLDMGLNNGLADYSLDIAVTDQVAGKNLVRFEQAKNENWKWGITDLLLTDSEPEPEPDPPVARSDGFTITAGSSNTYTLNVLSNDDNIDRIIDIDLDNDSDGDDDVFSSVQISSDGQSVFFTPDDIFDLLASGNSSAESFRYIVRGDDGTTTSANANVTINGLTMSTTLDDYFDLPTAAQSRLLEVLFNDTAINRIVSVDLDPDGDGTDIFGTVNISSNEQFLTYNNNGAFDDLQPGDLGFEEFAYTALGTDGELRTAMVFLTFEDPV